MKSEKSEIKKGAEMNDFINEKIGAWLLEDGHTKTTLAKELGLARPTLDLRLRGETEWKWCEVIKIARVTGCTLNELAGIAA